MSEIVLVQQPILLKIIPTNFLYGDKVRFFGFAPEHFALLIFLLAHALQMSNVEMQPHFLFFLLNETVPLDIHTFQRIANLPAVIAVAGHPVEAGHSLGQRLVVTGETDVDL